MPKRKRNSAAGVGGDLKEETASDECPFQVEYLDAKKTPKAAAASSKKRLKRGTGSQPTYVKLPKDELEAIETPQGSSSLNFRVLPMAAWDRLRQYKNFIVNGTHHTIGDFVQVRAGSFEQPGRSVFDDGTHWIARVLEIRASDAMHVYLRVIWMYWPRELPWGPQYYHGQNELVASNHMEIIGAATVSEGARVEHLLESPDGPLTIEGLFWRQKYDYANRNALAELRIFCVCGKFHNADKLLVHCENPKCGRWLHEDCLIKATLEKIMTDSAIAGEDSEETKVEDDQLQKELHESIEVTSVAKRLPRKSAASGSKVTGGQAPQLDGIRHPGYTLDEKLHGELEIKLSAKGDDNITGRLFVIDLRDEQSAPRTYPMHCLNCHRKL